MPIFRTGTVVGAAQWAPEWPESEPIPDLPPWDGGQVPKVPPAAPGGVFSTGRAPRVSVLGFGMLFGFGLLLTAAALQKRGRA